MMMKKLSEEHYIICDDSEIKEGDFVYSSDGGIFKRYIDNHCQTVFPISKVTHSTQPLDCACSNRGYKLNTNCAERNRCFDKVQYLPLQEVKELIGVVDVETKAHNWSTRQTTRSTDYWRSMVSTYVEAYNECLEDNKEKKYTETDIKNAIIRAYSMMGNTIDVGYFNEVIQSLQPKTEWEVEFVDGKLKLKQ